MVQIYVEFDEDNFQFLLKFIHENSIPEIKIGKCSLTKVFVHTIAKIFNQAEEFLKQGTVMSSIAYRFTRNL